jgi:RNA polymerase sigma-70 factor, ECF subfamily
MDHTRDMDPHGPLDVRYLAFLETIAQLRPRLHRYCSRMSGSVLDGEDVVQDDRVAHSWCRDENSGLRT